LGKSQNLAFPKTFDLPRLCSFAKHLVKRFPDEN